MNDLLTPSFLDTLVVSIILMGLFGLTATAAFAQNLARTTVSGEVKTPAGKPLEFATVLLLKAGDSTLVRGAAGDADGHYAIDNVMQGTYRFESRVARLTFTYNFGNRNIKGGGQRRSGAEDEQRRGGGSN